MAEATNSLKKTARLAGLSYLLLVITFPYGIMYVPSKIMVRGDAVATANNILANEFLFRTGIAGHLISQVIFAFLALVLYRLFKQVNEHQAKLMVALVIVQIPIAFLIEAFRITSLMILKGEVLKALEPEKLADMAMMFLKIHGYGISTIAVFFGLWLIPLGQLIYKSGFMPRILGVLLIIGGIAFTIDGFTFVLFPNYRAFTSLPALIFSALGEVSTMLWLLIKGVKKQPEFSEV